MDFSKQIQKAEEALARRNYDFAIDLFRQLLEIEPDLGQARSGLRQALRKRAEKQGSGRFLKAVGGALPLGRARTLQKLGRHDACARALEDFLAHDPLDEAGNLMLGRELELAGHLASARAVLEFLTEIAPRNVEAQKHAGALLRRLGEHARALECYERALAVDPRDQEALKARKDLAAEGAIQHTDLEGAGHSRERILDKDQAHRLEQEKRLHMGEDELRAELVRLEAFLAEAPSDPDRMLALADVHEKLRDPEAALDLIERAQSYRRDSFELLARAGDLRGKVLKRRVSQASKGGDEARADALERELQVHEVEDWSRRVAMRPGDAALRLQLGRRLERCGRLDEAVAELQKAVGDARIRREALFELALCFHQKGFLDLARQEYLKALDGLPPSSDRAKEILYNLGSISEIEKKPGEARSWYVRIFEADIGYRDVAAKMEDLKNA